MEVKTVTLETNEINYQKFFNGQRRISIPLFQRRYVWTKKNLDQLVEDISAIEDSQDSARFLGTIVAVSRPGSFSEVEEVEIVDGQQRTISIYLFICAIAEIACDNKIYKMASKLVTRILIFPDKDLDHTTTLYPSLEDRHEFQIIMQILRESKGLSSELNPFEIRPPATTGIEPPIKRQEMLAQYYRIRRYVASRIDGLDPKQTEQLLGNLSNILISSLTFVSLKLRDPSSAPLIFQSLNEKGVKTTIGDLVRNEIFSKVYEDPSKAQAVYSLEWQPFYLKFEGSFDDYLFPFCLTYDHTITKSECFQQLRTIWKGINDPSEIIKDLERYARTFSALELMKPLGVDKELDDTLKKFYYSNVPSSTYPFIFQVVDKYISGGCSLSEIIGVLKAVESFLVRRAVCGIEPTGLHAVFKSLWSDLGHTVSPLETTRKLSTLTTQEWPTDEEVKKWSQ